MKYRPLFIFLQRHAANVANEVQRAYVGAVRTYFETGFRRYLRSLGWVKVMLILRSTTSCVRLNSVGAGSNSREVRHHHERPGVRPRV